MATKGDETIQAEAAREALAANDAIAVDIRDDEGWRSGHVPAARRMSEEEISDLDEPDKQVIVVCEDGKRSSGVADKLRESGANAVALDGGMEAWKSADLGMQPSTDPDDDAPI